MDWDGTSIVPDTNPSGAWSKHPPALTTPLHLTFGDASPLDCSWELSGCSRLHQQQLGSGPTLKILLSELQCNCALGDALGNTLVQEGPWKAPVVLLLPWICDSYHTAAINPSLVKKRTHILVQLFSYWVGTSSLVNELMRHQNCRAVFGDVQRLFAQWYCAITIHFDSVFPSSPCSWFIWIVAKMVGCLGN